MAVGCYKQCWRGGEGAGEKAEEIEGCGIRPVAIVQQDECRLSRGSGGEKVPDPGKDLGLIGGGAGRVSTTQYVGRQRAIDEREAGEEVDPWAVRRRLGEIEAAPDEDERSPFYSFATERLGERGLADARLAADEHEATPPGQGGG
jgi:hypothetical protein